MKLFFSPAGERLSTDLPQRRELSGKRILITGAAKGIGAGIAEVFAENGADLLLHYRSSPEEAEALKTRLSAFGGAIHLCRADLGTKEGIETLFAEADRVFGGLDAAVNNAGWDPGYMALEDITFENYEKLTSMNIRGTLFCCLNEIRRMRRNTPSGGSIVNIGSVQMETSVRGRTLYAASKGAIHSLTGELALEGGVADLPHEKVPEVAGGQLGVDRLGIAGDHGAVHQDGPLRTHGLGGVERAALSMLGVERALRHAGAIAQVAEDQTAVVAATPHPSGEGNLLADVLGAKLAGGAGVHGMDVLGILDAGCSGRSGCSAG